MVLSEFEKNEILRYLREHENIKNKSKLDLFQKGQIFSHLSKVDKEINPDLEKDIFEDIEKHEKELDIRSTSAAVISVFGEIGVVDYVNEIQSNRARIETLSAGTISGVISYVSGNIHQMSNFPAINGAGKNISSIFVFKLYRDDNIVTGDVLASDIDIHYLKDGFGSRKIGSKY